MKVDGRKLNHSQLEAIRFRGGQGGAGWRAADGGCTRDGALYKSRVCLVGRVPRGWMGRSSCAEGQRSPEASDRIADEVDLQHSYFEEPDAAAVSICVVDEGVIRTLIWRKYRIKLSLVSVGRLLAQMGLTCQKPLSRAFEQDATLVKAWVKREFPKLQALAKKERAVIFFSDESGVRSDFHAGTTWGIRGQTPVVRHTGKRFHLNMLSAISAKGELGS